MPDRHDRPAASGVLRPGWRVVRGIVAPHSWPLSISVVGSFAFALASVLSTVVLGRVVDDLVLASFDAPDAQPGLSELWLGVTAVLALAVIRSAGVVLRRFYAGMTAERVQLGVRDALADQYLDRPRSWLRANDTGRLLAHVDSDVKVLVEALHPLPFSLAVAFLALFSSIALFAVDPLMALLALFVFPLIGVLNRWYSNLVQQPLSRTQESVGVVSNIAHESFEGALIVKTLGIADREVARFDEAAEDLERARVQVGYLRAINDAILDIIPILGTLAAVAVAGVRVGSGAMTPGDVVLVAALFSLLAIPVRVFGFFLENLAPSVIAWQRLSPVLNGRFPARPDSLDGPVDETLQPQGHQRATPVAVQVRGVSYQHADGTTALHDIDFDVEAREMLAVVGRTGSGKTTLCSVLAGLVEPSTGRVDTGDVRATLAFQEAFLFADSLRNNIDLRGDATDEALRAVAGVAQMEPFVDKLGERFDTLIGERGVTLSGGQRQRTALARALLSQRGLLILDDATSAVDSVVEQRILRAVQREAEATVIVVAHRLSTITLADRVLFLDAGRIAGLGQHAELLNDERYRSLVMAYSDEVV